MGLFRPVTGQLYLFYWLLQPTCGFLASSFLRFRDHTQGRTTVGRTPLDEWSARRRDLNLTNTQHSRQTSMPPGGIRTLNSSKRTAADLCLRPLGHWDRLTTMVCIDNYKSCFITLLSRRYTEWHFHCWDHWEKHHNGKNHNKLHSLLNAPTILLCTKITVPNYWFSFLFEQKKIQNPLLEDATLIPSDLELHQIEPITCYYSSAYRDPDLETYQW